MGEIDQLMKKLLVDHAEDLIRHSLQIEDPLNLEVYPGEIPDSPRELRMDVVLKSKISKGHHPNVTDTSDKKSSAIHSPRLQFGLGSTVLFHYEIQDDDEPNMGLRLLKYDVRLLEFTKLPVLSFALWLKKHNNIPEPPFQIHLGDMMILSYHYVNIKVYEFTKDQVLRGGVGMLLLAPLVTAISVKELKPFAQALYTQCAETERKAAVTMFRAFVEYRLKRSPLKASHMLKIDDMLRKVGFDVNDLDDILAKTSAAVRVATLAREEGVLEGKIELLLTIWNARFGTPTSTIQDAIKKIDSHVIDRMTAQIVTAATVDDAISVVTARK